MTLEEYKEKIDDERKCTDSGNVIRRCRWYCEGVKSNYFCRVIVTF